MRTFSLATGADKIGVAIGDFASAGVNATFRLVDLVYNTITNLPRPTAAA